MAMSKKQLKCTHSFQATDRKAVLKVESTSRSIRGKPKKVDVVATIFECSKCGAQKEYPDSWEQGFRLISTEQDDKHV